MNLLSVQTLANLFTVSGALLGIPSVMVLIIYVIHIIRLRFTSPAALSEPVRNPDAILMTLNVMTQIISGLARFVGGVEHFLLNGLAIAAVFGLFLGAAFWFTGRGLHGHAGWARLSAFAIVLLALLSSTLLALSLHNAARVVMVLIVIGCTKAIRTLWTGYVPQTY